MPKDKSENHEKIIEEAKKEFLQYGFKDASMRRIANACKMSVAGLYKHFPSKEEMFSFLVQPIVDLFFQSYNNATDNYYNHAKKIDTSFLQNSHAITKSMEFFSHSATILQKKKPCTMRKP